jgi:phosphoribosylanthranilate isomerase
MEGFPLPLNLEGFTRIQVNHRSPDPIRLYGLQREKGKDCIAQTRSSHFPDDEEIDWLFDTSGGTGKVPASWPKYPGRFVGYAGGINPANVRDIIDQIDASGPYWIDMENGVRTNDRFDLDLCRQVCEAVYGAAK